MEFFDYNSLDEDECDRVLDEADPCEECGEVENLALVVVTSADNFGSLLIFCTGCNRHEEDSFLVEKREKILYA